MKSEIGGGGNVANHPDLYDLLHSEYQKDVALYLRLSEGCDAVLECGVGTGRIAIPLARAGRTVHGIDKSPAMLERLEMLLEREPTGVADRIHLYEADMCSFGLNRTFRFAYIPFMTFNYLLDIEAQLACLGSIRSHMDPNGVLLIEAMAFYPEWFYNDGMLRLVARRVDRQTGASVEIFRVTRYDSSTQIVEHHRYYRFSDTEGRLDRERTVLLRNRFFNLGEARLLLEKAGFEIGQVWGDHAEGPYDNDSQVMILLASPSGLRRKAP